MSLSWNSVFFPGSLFLLEDAQTFLRKRKLCPKKLCHLRGSPQFLGNILGTIAAENQAKPSTATQEKTRRINILLYFFQILDLAI